MVPVDLGVTLVVVQPQGHHVIVGLGGVLAVNLVARQIAVVVGTRVLGVVPVEGGGVVEAEGKSCCGLHGELVVRGVEVVGQQEGGLELGTHAGVALFALVPAPVGVVVVVV